ncbi:MAG TPA: UDP-N-acetylmuramate--L-alanine ligase [Polyangiales bacterium]|jgi:UDP-N-acetylmuramate--alanine ligase|nr:UDP-N-acetylmuramate--L-alanine ligase [Polyangiales bacterium]
MFRGRIRTIHFVGIGGIGMSGIAEVLLAHGFSVSGSDLAEGETTRRLASLGAKIHVGHRGENVRDADVVVFSSAVVQNNPELVEARHRSIPVIPRAEMLAELMRLQDGIAIAGSHGKTTTTSLVATVLRAAGLDPTVIIGGKLNVLGSGAARGHGEFLVAEADESDGSFLHLVPVISAITNIDPEHLDHYKTLEAVKEAFVKFANNVPFYGLVIACLDHPHVQDILPRIEKRVTTYGFSAQADYSARNLTTHGLSSRFTLVQRGVPQGELEVRMPGVHNVQNALAVIAVADELGVDRAVVREALATFQGVQRRFTIRGEQAGITVVDDYGHHPAEVEATLAAAQRAYGRRIVVAFQPHRYSRTHHLFDELTRAFNGADVLFLTDVYAAGEKPIPGADSEHLQRAIHAHGHRDVTYVPARGDLVKAMLPRLKAGDIVITLGAGNITQTGPELLDALAKSGVKHGP